MQEKRQKKNIGEIIDKKYFTKEELQDHDRELVKEVCEKIKYKLGSIEDILINLGNGKEDALNYFTHILNEIEKEFEK